MVTRKAGRALERLAARLAVSSTGSGNFLHQILDFHSAGLASGAEAIDQTRMAIPQDARRAVIPMQTAAY